MYFSKYENINRYCSLLLGIHPFLGCSLNRYKHERILSSAIVRIKRACQSPSGMNSSPGPWQECAPSPPSSNTFPAPQPATSSQLLLTTPVLAPPACQGASEPGTSLSIPQGASSVPKWPVTSPPPPSSCSPFFPLTLQPPLLCMWQVQPPMHVCFCVCNMHVFACLLTC